MPPRLRRHLCQQVPIWWGELDFPYGWGELDGIRWLGSASGIHRRKQTCRLLNGLVVPPSLSTFRRVLRRLHGEAAAFGGWLARQVPAGLAGASWLVIALGGKAVRGPRAGDEKARHLLAAMITGARAVIAQKDVDAKTDEALLADYGIGARWSRRARSTCRRAPPATSWRRRRLTTCSPLTLATAVSASHLGDDHVTAKFRQ